MTPEIRLPKVSQNRISRLAQAADRSPRAMLLFVMSDGFEAVETCIKENAIADAQFDIGSQVAHDDVMRDALKALHQVKYDALAKT